MRVCAQACGRLVSDAGEAALATAGLHPAITGVWAPAAGWRVAAVRAGVRSMPRRTNEGTLPLAGRLDSGAGSSRWGRQASLICSAAHLRPGVCRRCREMGRCMSVGDGRV